MPTHSTQKPDVESNFLIFLAKTFWRVFTLPFRAIGSAYRQMAAIPIKHLILMAVIFAGLIALTLVLFVKVTSQPAFCVTCHYMKPYFASWEESSHNQVHCTECHFPPGVKSELQGKFTTVSMLVNYATGVYRKSKPWAEISDASCLQEGCHETRFLQGQVPFKEGIVFDHTHHLTEDRRGKTLRCTSCHSQIVQGTHMTVTEETCFLCHFKDQPEGSRMTACTRCHEAPVAGGPATAGIPVVFDHSDLIRKGVNCRLCHGEMAHGDGDVPQDRCSYCHAEVGKIEQYSQTTQIHRIHITEHKVECNQCHNTILHRSIARSGDIKPDCQACHLDRHLAQYNLFSGQGAVGVDPLPAPMFHAGLGCKACHVLLPPDWQEHPGLATMKAGAASCEPCHEKGYFKLYTQAKPVLQRRFSNLKSRIGALRAKLAGVRADSVLDVASHNIQFAQRAIPIHNLNYTDRILQEVSRSLDILEGKKPSYRALPDTTSERCLRCHYGQDEVDVRHEDKIFSHRNHVHNAKVGCSTCHLEEQPRHGQLKKGPFCMDCHHQSAAVSCDPCHTAQQALIEARGIFSTYDPDLMFEAGLACRDCHQVVGKDVARPTAATCQACHEPGYWENFQGDLREITNTLTDIESRLNDLPESPERDRAFGIIDALKADGTRGGHNLRAAQEALETVRQLLEPKQSAEKGQP